jgi:glucose/arabinose dehydrogenase
MALRPGDPSIYVATQGGRVVGVRDGRVQAPPVLDLTDRVLSGGEQGLLGIAFAPDGNHLYAHFTDTDGNTRVEEYPVSVSEGGALLADPAGRRPLVRIRDREYNHNGGQLAFGPDGRLYLGMGDGGGAGDQGNGHAPGGNGQSPDTLLGKILRIDLDRGGASICDLGLRNPWRFSFDRATGDLWIADVGQNSWEEIDRLAAPRICGHNLGWNVFEGRARFRDGEVPDAVAPVAVLSHEAGNCAVIGGYVYRGTAIPRLSGWYVFTDYCNGRLRALRVGPRGASTKLALGPTVREPSSFGEDANGELYVLSQRDGLFAIQAR